MRENARKVRGGFPFAVSYRFPEPRKVGEEVTVAILFPPIRVFSSVSTWFAVCCALSLRVFGDLAIPCLGEG